MVKKKTENQSRAEPKLRCKIGSANAASTAREGKTANRARSLALMATEASSPTNAVNSGTAVCRCVICLRQCQMVSAAKGSVGQVNQTSRRSTSPGPSGQARRHDQPGRFMADKAVASTSANTVDAATQRRC